MEGDLTRIILLIPLLLAASTEGRTGKNWRYWPNIGCFDFNFERTVFFEVTNGATELSATKGLELSTIVNSSLVPSLDNELQVQHVLTGSIRNSTTNTPEECITFCNATEYAYAGLQEGNRCVCMNEPPLAKTTAERCNAACSGDGSLSCGGEWTMDVHQNPHYHSSNLTYIGCFKNSYNDFDRLLIEGEFNNFRNNTPEWCVEYCTNRDYDYAGLQYGSQCICTNTGPQENSEEGKCTYGCAGDQSIKMCGGLGYINIFHTDAHKTTIDDWGCGNSAQDQYYQKWYADMDHCGLTEELPSEDCRWASWGPWTSCSESCSAADGTGDQRRTREIGSEAVNDGTPCNAAADGSETRSCTDACPVNCQTGVWGDWSSCADSCPARDGTGNQTRTRTPNVYATNGGADCVEPTSENLACMYNCPVDCSWSSWTAWGSCSASCNGGTQGRYRNSTIEGSNGGAVCAEGDRTQLQTCNTDACPSATYRYVKSGHCNRITSVEECERAARVIGNPDTSATVYSWASSEPGYFCNCVFLGKF